MVQKAFPDFATTDIADIGNGDPNKEPITSEHTTDGWKVEKPDLQQMNQLQNLQGHFIRANNEFALRADGYEAEAGEITIMDNPASSGNGLLWSEDFSDAAWVDISTPVITANTTDALDGTTTADTIEDNGGATVEGKIQSITILDDSLFSTVSVFILKDSDETRFPELNITLTDGTPVTANVQLNTSTGALASRSGTASTEFNVTEYDTYWRLDVRIQNNTSGNVNAEYSLLPARGTTLGGATSTNGTIIAWGAMLHTGNTLESYSKTEDVAGITAGNVFYRLPSSPLNGQWAMVAGNEKFSENKVFVRGGVNDVMVAADTVCELDIDDTVFIFYWDDTNSLWKINITTLQGRIL